MRRVQAWLENLLRRHPWVIPLVAMVPCAYFAARGTSDLVAARLFAADTDALARPVPGAIFAAESEQAPVENRHVRDRAAIVHRNIFDSDAGCLDCDAAADGGMITEDGAVVVEAPREEIVPPEPCDTNPAHAGMHHPDPCDTQAKIAGAVESDDPLWSFVFIQAASTGPAMPYRMGQTVDNRTVGVIGWCPVLGVYTLLRPAGGQRCFLAQVMPPRPAPAPAQPATPAPAAGANQGSELTAIIDQGVERVGPNEFNVRRQTVDRILENQAELMRTTRIMPHEEGGRVTGVQLFGVRSNTLLGRLGMQNGDVLNQINGLDIASPDRALEAYSRLRSADHLQISVSRNGTPVNIDFNIR